MSDEETCEAGAERARLWKQLKLAESREAEIARLRASLEVRTEERDDLQRRLGEQLKLAESREAEIAQLRASLEVVTEERDDSYRHWEEREISIQGDFACLQADQDAFAARVKALEAVVELVGGATPLTWIGFGHIRAAAEWEKKAKTLIDKLSKEESK